MDRIETLQTLLESQPGDSFLQHALALEHIKRNNDDAARKLFEAILAADENYVGSYYHLSKLLEREGKRDAAIAVYERGMLKAKETGDDRAYQELRAAYEDLIY